MSADAGLSILGGRPSYRRLLRFSLPLATTGLLISLETPAVSAGIARSPAPEIGLAGFGVLTVLAFWVEAPTFMLIDASTARCTDRLSYRVIRRYALICSAIMVSLMTLLALTPLGQLVLRQLLGVSAPVADDAARALLLFLPWPAAVAWRRLHQGVLIRSGLTRLVALAVALRTMTTLLVIIVGATTGLLTGARLGAAAFLCGALVESTCSYLAARPVLRSGRGLPLGTPEQAGAPSLASFNRYYLPLAGSALFFFLNGPVIAAGIARAAQPTASLAAWPVALALGSVVFNSLNSLQLVSIRLGTEPDSAQLVRRFVLGAGITLTVTLLVANASGLSLLVLVRLLGMPDELRQAVMTGVWILTPVPLLVAIRSLERGRLVRLGATRSVQLASALNLVTLAAMLFGVTAIGRLPGYLLGAVAYLAATGLEAGFLWYRSRHQPAAQGLVAELSPART